MRQVKVAVLAGDGIGEEVMAEALKVLEAVTAKSDIKIEYKKAPIGGAAFDATGEHFPSSTREVCAASDAILFGSVGGPVNESHMPKWKNCETNSLLGIRKEFNFFANLRPIQLYAPLKDASPLREDVIKDGVSILIIRELVGDVYFGEHRLDKRGNERYALDVGEYTETQIRRITHTAFKAARGRRKIVHSVDKANVLSTSKLWREIVTEVAREYPDITLHHMLVDNCAMQLVKNPGQFDVLLTANLFGDILSDLGAALPGSLGLTPSASLNEKGFGLYEPSGGSAPDIAGKGIANPTAQILSAAMMLRLSFGMENEAAAIERAVNLVFEMGMRTRDLAGNGEHVSTKEFGDAVKAAITV